MASYLIDLDGTIYRGDKALPGAAQWIDYLQRSGQDYLFLTNCPLNSPQSIADKLCKMGVQTDAAHVLTCAQATVDYLLQNRAGKTVLPLCSPAFVELMQTAGIVLAETDADIVVTGHTTSWEFDRIEAACNRLLQGAELVAANPDPTIPLPNGVRPHTGALTAALVAATGVAPTVIGKPYGQMLQTALHRWGVSHTDAIYMIGDRLDTDILFAQNNGLQSILVLTGDTTQTQAQTAACPPDLVVSGLPELLMLRSGKV